MLVKRTANSKKLDAFSSVIYEDTPEEYLWEKGCLLRCDMALKLPIYVPVNKMSDLEEVFSFVTAAAAAKFNDPHVAYLVEGTDANSEEVSRSIVLHGIDLEFNQPVCDQKGLNNSTESDQKALACSFFCSKHKCIPSSASREIQSKLLSYPTNLEAVQYPVPREHNTYQLCPYHFLPPGFLHPITSIFDLKYGETEVAQAEIRKSLHERLGLPLDRPLLRVANALAFGINGTTEINLKSTTLLKDVHTEIPSSGVSGASMSLVDGSYEYYHYLHDGIDDNGWGCAYRSLQTIISWFRLQHYTSIKVPSHREIQQALVEIGDKEPAFVGSREWIGAIELSFVLDKLLGVSSKIMNVRSGSELPEKCRELALHFETQGTPIMIGGGVLAYTLLGVNYNEVSGDCAFLILDPHYTGTDDLKKIVNGGWCGWKKAVDSKGRNFFLKDKFYNLLLPQRPNMV